jgi:hypothetical protein
VSSDSTDARMISHATTEHRSSRRATDSPNEPCLGKDL